MQVDFDPDLESKLARIASERGRSVEMLVAEAVQRFVDYDEWFKREVEQGISAADRGELVEHDAVRSLIDRRYPG
jgi:predicted transcriptional regulator